MNKKDRPNITFTEHFIYYLFGFMPLFATFFVYPDIPDKIPFSYNYLGEISSLDHKAVILIVPFALSVITYLFPDMVIFKYDDETENKVSKYAMLLFMLCVNLIVYLQLYLSLKGVEYLTRFNLFNILGCGICLIGLFLGNLFSKGNRSCTFCIKTSTYFMSDKIWKLLHNNLGSYLISSSIVCLPICLFCHNEFSFFVLILECLAIIIAPIVFVLLYLNKYKK